MGRGGFWAFGIGIPSAGVWFLVLDVDGYPLHISERVAR